MVLIIFMKINKLKKQQWISRSAEETQSIGHQIAQQLRSGDVVALRGELGAGKTTLVKGIACGLGVSSVEEISSPTYVLIHEYQGRQKVYHLDWYRLEAVLGADAALAQECFDSKGITLVEWPERGETLLPQPHWQINLKHQDEKTRKIEMLHG